MRQTNINNYVMSYLNNWVDVFSDMQLLIVLTTYLERASFVLSNNLYGELLSHFKTALYVCRYLNKILAESFTYNHFRMFVIFVLLHSHTGTVTTNKPIPSLTRKVLKISSETLSIGK